MATEKVSAYNAATHYCLLQFHCEKIANVLIEIEPHDTFQFRVLNEYFVFAFCLKLYSLSKSSWGKILRYYQHSSVPKILADESCKNFGIFLLHMMRQTHPQLAGTIREKKIKFGQQLNEVSWKEEKKLMQKSQMK